MASAENRGWRLEGWRRELVAEHVYLVRMHLRQRVFLPKAPRRRKETADLYQEGCVGLIEAALRYTPGRDGLFAPYALARIRRTVHRAIHETFATVRIPLRTVQKWKAAARRKATEEGKARRTVGTRLPRLFSLPPAADRFARSERVVAVGDVEGADGRGLAACETIGEHLRAKCRIALTVAADRVAKRCRRPGRRAVLGVLADERLSIPCEQERTSLRTIQRQCGVSSGRLAGWQRAMEREAREILSRDGELSALREAAAGSEAREEQGVDPVLAALLTELRGEAFRRAVRSGAGGKRAAVTAKIVEHAGPVATAEPEAVFASLACEAQREVLARMPGEATERRGERGKPAPSPRRSPGE